MLRIPLVLVFSALLLAGCSSEVREPWGDEPKPLTTFESQINVESLWSSPLAVGRDQYYLHLRPWVDGEVVYRALRHGRVMAQERLTGKTLWSRDLDAEILAGVGAGNEQLLLGVDEQVLALDKASGHTLWRSSLSSEVLIQPVRHKDRIIVRTVDGAVYALDAASGQQQWQYRQAVPSLSLRGLGQLLVSDEMVLVGFASGKLQALDLSSGKLRWQANVGLPSGRTELERLADVDASLSVANRLVFASSYQGRLMALTEAGGQLIWTRDIPSYTGMSSEGEALYISDEQGMLWALDQRSGATLWKQNALSGRHITAPGVQGDYVVVADHDGYVHWLSRSNGRLAARTRVDDWYYDFPVKERHYPSDYEDLRGILVPPIVDGTEVFVVDRRGVLSVFRSALPEVNG